ncbi:hypothetical protein [Kineosporia sp. NBRC 101731]|nr:hypothetical protein [Kineosporia sp. NBRC 101731]
MTTTASETIHTCGAPMLFPGQALTPCTAPVAFDGDRCDGHEGF